MWLLRESDFRENNVTVEEWNKFYIELIILIYVHWKIAIVFHHCRLGLEDKFFPSKITKSPTYTTFIL